MTDHDDDARLDGAALDAATRAALTPDAVRHATRERLLARAHVDAPRHGRTPLRVPAASRTRALGTRYAIGGLVLALAASLVLLVRMSVTRTAERSLLTAQVAAVTRTLDSLGAVVAGRDQLLASLTGSQVRVVHLASAGAATPRALMFWNQANNEWTFIAHNLAPLRAGRTYQLWLVTSGSKISAGTFSVTPGGDAVVQATYALGRRALSAVAVTEEPAGGVSQPTGDVVVVGAVSAF